jgi:hypothetical protein
MRNPKTSDIQRFNILHARATRLFYTGARGYPSWYSLLFIAST